MSEDISNVPRRLRRFYRHGELVPEEMARDTEKNVQRNDNPIPPGENHDENEPWMNAPRAENTPTTGSRRNERRENARGPATLTNTNTTTPPKPGLFSRVLQGESKKTITPIDHALGLHDKEKFIEKTPNMSNQAMQQKPPSPTDALPISTRAQADIQKALQELRALAKNDGTTTPLGTNSKPAVSTASFHFTPAGEAPRAPESSERATQYPAENANANLSPRERAEQRRQGRESSTATVSNPVSSSSPSRPVSSSSMNESAHIRRRMGQLIDQERMDREDTPVAENKPANEKDDDDFKSLFAENKNKDKEKDTKKKKASADKDEDDMDEDEELELFEDDK